MPVPAPFDRVIAVDEFRRYEVDVPVLVGWSWPFAHVWMGSARSPPSPASPAPLGLLLEI